MKSDSKITGVYRHYKGKDYEVIGVGTHTETDEKFVVYRGLNEPYDMWIRPFDMFFGTVTVNGVKQLRFQKTDS
ncbi:MAG: hypothetical protein JWO54_127 [Candidatus Saccharibacteria bacterium]|nr:hypothetical protein [Candidatus Saccharibacteria bacterium]MDB5180369.1 hypothetical protein [Candidatus Saccharibacteria bacterium]